MPLVHPSARAIPDLALRGCQAADGLAGFSEAQPALVAKNSGRARTSRWPFFYPSVRSFERLSSAVLRSEDNSGLGCLPERRSRG